MSIKIPAKVAARITQQLKKYQSIVTDARKRDINESDTALIVADILADILGYKKIEEITSEHAIRGTYADLAVKVGSSVRFLVEIKAINIELKESHVTQAVNYAANVPTDWVLLTNGATWRAYKVSYSKPIDRVLVLDLDVCTANPKDCGVIEFFGNLSREVFTPDSMSQMFKAKQAMSKFSVAALMLSEPVVAMVRRELRKLADGLNPTLDEVRDVIEDQVIKRELIESDEAKDATKAVKRLARRTAAKKAAQAADEKISSPVEAVNPG
jgi:hypothetical protein